MKLRGDRVRQAREERAWTQEELSHRSGIGLRTVRRLESGHGSLESLRRVSEALELDPAQCLLEEEKLVWPQAGKSAREWLGFDPLRIEMSHSLVDPEGEDFAQQLVAPIGRVRNHIAREFGILMPGVRLRDFIDDGNRYRILVREVVRGEGCLPPNRFMAVAHRSGTLAGLDGISGLDPTYGMRAIWIEAEQREQAREQGCLVFDHLSVVSTHLTMLVRTHAAELIGVEQAAFLLDNLQHPRLVAEVVPARISLATFRTVLRNLLWEQVSIRDLALILETILDNDSQDPAELTEACRAALRDSLILSYADERKQILAIELDAEPDDIAPVKQACLRMENEGLQAIVVTSPQLRRRLRGQLEPHRVVLSTLEIPRSYEVRPFTPGEKG